jgi:glutaminyl-peptide cyclotransferase
VRTTALTWTLGLLAAAGVACPSSDVEQSAPRAEVKPPTPVSPNSQADTVAAKSETIIPRFSESLAWKHLTKQVGFGPRVAGMQGHKVCRRYLEQHLLENCEKVEKQDFTITVRGKDLAMTNLIGRFGLDKPRRIMLAAHWDTRPTADFNPQGSRNQPIDGANDGASGVAVLLELARVFKESPPPNGVDIVLFDGEDYGPGLDMMFLGAKHMAKGLSQAQIKAYNYGILIDMVGDASLDIHPELNSEKVAGPLYQVAMEVSRSLGYNCFKEGGAYEIYDDHLPMIERGLRMYDFIDFNYKHWHTTEDTVDKCSPKSLGAVGRTLEVMIYEYPQLYGPDK